MIRSITLGLLLAAGVVHAGGYFPLAPGNRWTYRADTGETFSITVGLSPIVTRHGLVYHKVEGYASAPLFIRHGENGALYWLNEEKDREELLTDFRPLQGAYYKTPIAAPCEQEGQPQERPVAVTSGGYEFTQAREIRYRVLNCADTGIASELYLENIGLVRRVNHTIAGPRVFDLVSAKIGPLLFSERPGVSFRMEMPSSVVERASAGDPAETELTLRLTVDRLEPAALKWRSSQRFDILVRDARGEVVYVWSADKAFLAVVSEELALNNEYSVPLRLDLRDGRYQVEAWLTTDSRAREFAGAVSLSILTTTAAGGRKSSAGPRRASP